MLTQAFRFGVRSCETHFLRDICRYRSSKSVVYPKKVHSRGLFGNRQNGDDAYIYDLTPRTLSLIDAIREQSRNPLLTTRLGLIIRFTATAGIMTTAFAYGFDALESAIERSGIYRSMPSASAFDGNRNTAPVTTSLVGLCTLLFGAKVMIPPLRPYLVRYGYLRLDLIWRTRLLGTPASPRLSILGATLSHRDFAHLAFNMLAIYNFGSFIERHGGGHDRVLSVFFGGALGGTIASLLLQRSPAPTLGASAAGMAMLAYVGQIAPELRVSPFGLPGLSCGMDTATMATVAYTLWGVARMWLTRGLHGPIDHAGHLGGLIVGSVIGVCTSQKKSNRGKSGKKWYEF
ncbi:hypothetical protein V1511DRAFT_491972 [Dipodascopsis uninucleata]